MDALLIVVFMVVLFVAIFVAISRWVFRINDIVGRLDSIVALLRKTQEK